MFIGRIELAKLQERQKTILFVLAGVLSQEKKSDKFNLKKIRRINNAPF